MHLLIVQTRPPEESETFIRAHFEHLPAQTHAAYGWPLHVDGRSVLSMSLPIRVGRAVRKLATGQMLESDTYALLQAFRDTRADAVMAEYGKMGVCAMDACERAKVPLIVHFHGADASVRQVLAQFADAYRRMFQVAAAIVAVSHSMRQRLISLGAPAEKVHYNAYGVECDRFAGGDPSQASERFIAVGRFVEKKAPHLTLHAFSKVLTTHPQAQLRMIGDGPLWRVCRDLAGMLEIEHTVTFLGQQPHDVVAQEMRSARAFVQHSIEASDGDCEGTPVAVLEAGASGLPVIATRHAGICDVVEEHRTGLLVDERDVDGMAEHMRTLLEQPALAAELGRAGRERIAAEFSMDKSIARLWNVIRTSAAQ